MCYLFIVKRKQALREMFKQKPANGTENSTRLLQLSHIYIHILRVKKMYCLTAKLCCIHVSRFHDELKLTSPNVKNQMQRKVHVNFFSA